MATNVSVSCRFRPPSKGEKLDGASIVATVDPTCTSVSLNDGSGVVKEGTNKFNFDRVFDFASSQAEVFKHTAAPLVKDVFNGYNTTVFAYGQTGSGKTHTMMGDPKSDLHKGIIPRLVEAIFQGIEDADSGIEFTVKLSYVEIYSERVRDLLTARNSGSDNLKIREGTHGGVYIEGVTETYVNSVEQILSLMDDGQRNRAVASTNMNETSSRSHSVFILTLGQLDQNSGSKKGAKLTLVDLAGSEKVGKTGATGQTLDEAKSINKSLSALGNVINALTAGGVHVPYRDSKLTRLLSDSLGGNSKTCLIITGSPMNTNLDETLSTMRFGTRAKLVKNKATKNEEKSVAEYKLLLHQANLKLAIQASIIEALEKDVAALMDCVGAVDESALKIPIPQLMSRDLAVLEAAKRGKGLQVEGEGGTTVEGSAVSPVANTLDLPAQLPPVVLSPAPTMPVAVAAAAAAAAADASDAAGAATAIAPVTPIPAPVLSTPVKPTARAVRRPTAITAGSGDNSPATSPDTSPDSSPRASPVGVKSPPVVLMGLPSLESLAAAAAPAASPTAAAASASASSSSSLSVPSTSTPTGTGASGASLPAHRKLSASIPGHSLSDLMLANSDLAQQVAELRQARQALEHNLEDNRKETLELAEEREKDKAAAAAAVEEERRLRREAEEKAEKATEVVGEVALLKQKIEYMKKEQSMALSQAEAARIEAGEEAARLAARLAHLEAAGREEESAAASATAAQEAEAEAAAAAAAATAEETRTAASASAPTTPVDTEKKKFRPRMSAPPEHMHHASAPSAGATSAMGGGSGSSGFHRSSYSMSTSLGSGGGGASGADYGSIEEQSQVEQLSRGLKRKCDQVVELMIQHQAQGERMEALEGLLEESNARLREHVAASGRKIKELDEKLLAAENLCAKFLESGRYWRQERNQKQKATSSKISMPMHGGGGGGKARADGPGGGGVGFGSPGAFGTGATTPGAMSPAAAGPGGGGSSVSSPAPAASASSRLSGGLALGARNAITSIQSAISGKPKDNMSAFF